MITVAEASEIILSNTSEFKSEQVSLNLAHRRILRQDLIADRPFPPFDRVTMDGIAVNLEGGLQELYAVEGVASAGSSKTRLSKPGACIEVMTGAMLPEGCDTVIRYEDLDIDEISKTARILAKNIRQGQNIHREGSDRTQGSILVKAGSLVDASVISVAATVGASKLQVSKMPRTMVISTGDELVSIESEPRPFQIRQSNGPGIKTVLESHAVHADLEHISDDRQRIKNRLSQIVADYDLVVLSGGVSMGKFDYVPVTLQELGTTEIFHRIKQRPGKPLWFGVHPGGCVIFGLPGNPVSSFLCTHRYVLPWIKASLGLSIQPYPSVILDSTIRFDKELTYFAQVSSYWQNEEYYATPIEGNGSGDLANLCDADGFVELPADRQVFEAGERFPFIRSF